MDTTPVMVQRREMEAMTDAQTYTKLRMLYQIEKLAWSEISCADVSLQFAAGASVN